MSGAAAAPAQAAPRGMQRIPIPLESYQHPSLPVSAKRLLNLMAEKQPQDARSPVILVPTPGLIPDRTVNGGVVGTGPIYAMNDDLPGRIYFVSGTHFFRWSNPGVLEDMGDIGATTGFYTIAVGQTGAVVCSPPNAYVCGHNPPVDVLNQITDPAFPGATSVTFCDGYFAFSSVGDSAQWFISRLADANSYDALDFVFSDAMPNVIRRLITHRGMVWTIGEAGFEIWYDAGAADFPFRRAAGGIIRGGTESFLSLAIADESLWWLGVDGVVYRSNGYEPVRVSTHAIEAIIGTNLTGATALTHAYRGHWFYCLTTIDNRTLCYDMATQAWHERSTSTDGNAPWRALTAATGGTVKLFGDRSSGQLYTLYTGANDAVVYVIRQAIFPPIWASTRRAYCARLEVEMQVGTSDTVGQITLDWSDDGGWNFNGGGRVLDAGQYFETRQRVFTTRLGSFRQRVFRITAPGLTRIYAVDADITAGNW